MWVFSFMQCGLQHVLRCATCSSVRQSFGRAVFEVGGAGGGGRNKQNWPLHPSWARERGGHGGLEEDSPPVPRDPGSFPKSINHSTFLILSFVLLETISPVIPVVLLLCRTYKSTDIKFTLYKIYKGQRYWNRRYNISIWMTKSNVFFKQFKYSWAQKGTPISGFLQRHSMVIVYKG